MLNKDKDAVAEFEVLKNIEPALEAEKPVRSLEFNEDEQKIVKGLFLLTSKPVLYVANIAEEDMADPTSTALARACCCCAAFSLRLLSAMNFSSYRLNVESKFDDVTILNFICFTFKAQATCFFNSLHAPIL